MLPKEDRTIMGGLSGTAEDHEVRDRLVHSAGDEDMLFADGFDKAIIGYIQRCGQPAVVVYDRLACIDILVAQGLTEEDSEEFFEFNVVGAWVGDRTPAFLVRPGDYE